MTGDTPLWRAADAAEAVGTTTRCPWKGWGVSIDSRTVQKGDIFVALSGPNFDGHDYAAQAFEKGAAAAILSREVTLPDHSPRLMVADTDAALRDLGLAARARMTGRVAAVTGSVGKTGTKEALRTVLADQGPTHATSGNLNNHWGVPLSLARMPADSAYGVFELGMNHPGELTELTAMVRPHVAVVTTVAAAHVEFFSSVADVAEAKAEIFKGLDGGTAIVPRDNEHYALLADRARSYGAGDIVSFGGHHESDARLLSSMMDAETSVVSADIAGQRINYQLNMSGHHWVVNSLAVLAAAAALGADLETAAASISKMRPLPGRGARHRIAIPGGSFELLDESYNASPAAMRAAFETLKLANPTGGGRRIAVLGDMRELGDEADALHAGLAEDLVAEGADLVLAAGPHMAALYRELPDRMRGAHAGDAKSLEAIVLDIVGPGDVVLVKGSLGSRMGPIVEALRALATDGAAQDES